jgi:hypothetical protein
VPSGVVTPFSATFTLGATDATNGLMVEVFTSNTVTCTNKNFALSDWQLELGSVKTPYEMRPIGVELALCQRYYYAPVQANVGDTTAALCMGMGYNGSALFGVVPLPNMRATPTINSSASGTWQWSQGGASYNSTSTLGLQEASPFIYTLAFTASSATTNAAGWIRRNTAAGYVNFSAEL